MFLCHFQILCGVPAERTDRAGTCPRHGATGPETWCLKKPVFLQQSGNLVVISSCDTCLWNLPWGLKYGDLPPGPPTALTRTHAGLPRSALRVIISYQGLTLGVEGHQKEGWGPFDCFFVNDSLCFSAGSTERLEGAWVGPGGPWEGKSHMPGIPPLLPTLFVCLF